MNQGTLNVDNNATSGAPLTQGWDLDAKGNWKSYDQPNAAPAYQTTRGHNAANEITSITTDSGAPTWAMPPGYDDNGNMTTIPQPHALDDSYTTGWDAWNRLVTLTDDAASDQLVAQYEYDGLGRRTIKKSYTGGSLDETRHYYFSDQWQVLEERVGSSTDAERQYLWGLRYVDDLVMRERDTNGDGTLNERLYALQDALFNVVALANTSGSVVERFAYQPYGESEALNPDFSTYSGTDYEWDVRFTGRELDRETGLQINRHRYLHHQLGRWVSRDPIGYKGGISLFSYESNAPLHLVDPMGTTAFLAGCGVGAIWSGGTSLVISVIQDGLTWAGCCNAGCSAAASCIQSGLVAQFPSPITACASAFLAKIIRRSCKAYICGTDEPWNACDAISLLASCTVGVVAGGLPAPKPPAKIHPDLYPLLKLLGINVAAWTAACKAGQPAPPAGVARACCTFRKGNNVWSEEVDCGFGRMAFGCCRELR